MHDTTIPFGTAFSQHPASPAPAPAPDVRVLRLADRDATLARATGSPDARVQGWLVNDLAVALGPPPLAGVSGRGDAAAREDRLCAAVSALCDIGPRDTLEGMLAAQMVAVHAAALDCLRRAADGAAADRLRHSDLRNATRLLNVFERQLKVRDDRRNPELRRGVAGARWNRPGGRHLSDAYGCGGATAEGTADGTTDGAATGWQAARAAPATDDPPPVEAGRRATGAAG